jgi:glycyl-tRNA synthetase
MTTFQQMLHKLEQFWEKQGCIIQHGYDLELGAGTLNPATFFRSLGPEPYQAFYIEPCRRPTDGRYGTNPNRLQHYFQCQVILKPSPENIQDLCLQSLEAIGFDLNLHDMRFVHDDWENPTIGAWGLGWEVWMDGMEVTQFTYFQSVAGISLKPITGEVTYGLERLAMHLQKVDSIFDIKFNDTLTYGDIYLQNEVEWSHYNFEQASTSMWHRHFEDYEKEAKRLIEKNLPIPAYDFVIKASHAFNILDARGVISVTERTGYIARIRDLACQVAACYLKSREAQDFPLLQKKDKIVKEKEPLAPIEDELLKATPEDCEDFLLEIGSEELPATFVPIGCKNLENDLKTLLEKESLTFASIHTYGTPRRLAIYVKKLALATKPHTVEKRGPTVEQAYSPDGKLKPAGEGFFRAIGITSPSLESIRSGETKEISVRQIKGANYLFAEILIPSKSTATILCEHLPGLILNLDFPKKMRWADLDITYPRPLRWIVALLGNHILPFHVGNLESGRESYGHRQLRPWNFSLIKASDYLPMLREHKVMADSDERMQSILSQLDELERKMNGKVIGKDRVLPQVLNLVEWPFLTYAEFDPVYLKAPKEVLVSEMIEHQKYFPVVDRNEILKNLFVITANNHPSDTIRAGNRKALSPRLSDGVFLYGQGLKSPLSSYNEKLKHIIFQKELGSVYDKIQRIMADAEILQKRLGIGNLEQARRAAELCKADIATEMVFEFPELQGIIGRHYAEAQGEDSEVATAIEEHWMPRGENAPLPQTNAGIIVSLADKIDNLIGCYRANLKPSSSSDPYALRRQALGLIKLVIKGRYHLPLMEVFNECYAKTFPQDSVEQRQALLKELESFLVNRVKTVFLDYEFNKDEIEAGLSSGFTDIYDAFCKVSALHKFRLHNEKFPKLYEVYKRAKGQINDLAAVSFSDALLQEKAEKELDRVLKGLQAKFNEAIQARDYDKAYEMIAEIQPALATLFDEVKILADDPKIQTNRIALLQRVFELFSQLLDFSKIQYAG